MTNCHHGGGVEFAKHKNVTKYHRRIFYATLTYNFLWFKSSCTASFLLSRIISRICRQMSRKRNEERERERAETRECHSNERGEKTGDERFSVTNGERTTNQQRHFPSFPADKYFPPMRPRRRCSKSENSCRQWGGCKAHSGIWLGDLARAIITQHYPTLPRLLS